MKMTLCFQQNTKRAINKIQTIKTYKLTIHTTLYSSIIGAISGDYAEQKLLYKKCQ